ncbi:AAA family ATPase [Flavobacterium sp. XN-5]|uniref:ATP-dependent nuclease n=1 Tax=Flavobacterium sp. XN-5 TaxID=2599390 RepID=UPI0011C97A51|nr:AAA family ATPase [Flavobacterium sp. XN-5]NGY38996.1 AAA family ATPase [Flavobacterium sp. XN-5]
MAKKNTGEEEEIMLSMPRPRLTKLIVKNFRCIGSTGVEIDLDEIVVLVGPNNVGKSSLLRAYEIAMSDGSNASKLSIDDFPNRKLDENNLPQIELHTIIYDERVGAQWIQKFEDGWLVKEKWTWKKDNILPERQGWDININDWHEKSFPFGPANIANLRRPDPHSVKAFDTPESQTDAIKKIILSGIQDKIKGMQAADADAENEYQQLLQKVGQLQSKIVDESREQIDKANVELSNLISNIFPNYEVNFDAKVSEQIDLKFLSPDADLTMGPKDGYQSSIEKQGSGARRTLLWTALKYVSEINQKVREDGKPSRPHLLLLDEPEICLHPNAIREACNVLYSLPTGGNWQVMVTTHSPVFIDFSRNNTSIVRVEKNDAGEIKGTTVFRPKKAKLDLDDMANLKLLNLCDPYVAEFFFGGKVIIVEGDTEYTAFNYIKNRKPELYKDVHIIRARGKATIVSLVKILNQFGANYSVLHDSDRVLAKDGIKKSPAWGNNPNILNSVAASPEGTKVRLLASLPNFEEAYFGEEIKLNKPYNALQTISTDAAKFDIVEKLLKSLINHEEAIPPNCSEWSTIEQLEADLLAVCPN